MGNFEGKTAIVTGGASGIGFAISAAFAEAGAKVAIWDFDEDAAEASAAKIVASGKSAEAVFCNVADAGGVTRALNATREAFGGV
ncbi:MAG: SDR family NAD(P)-dependent oxidoreductase, partial [Verrucomicrobiota bacterium]